MTNKERKKAVAQNFAGVRWVLLAGIASVPAAFLFFLAVLWTVNSATEWAYYL